MAKLKKTTKQRKEYINILTSTMVENLSDEFILSVPCDIFYNLFDDYYIDNIVDRVFNYYRIVGFPYYNLTDEEILTEYHKFNRYDISNILLDNNELNQTMHCLNVTNSFFDNMFNVKCRNKLTPLQVFNDDKLLKNAIRRRIKMSDSPLKPYNIRKSLKIFSGTQSVSGFRPTIAKYLIESLFKDKEKVDVLDPCMGWGGRMLGFCSSDKINSYVGFDVSTETINGLNKLKDKLIELKISKTDNIFVYKKPFEDSDILLNNHDKFDFVMTSPPYFNTEEYSNDKEQSYIKYNTYDKWVNGFLKPLIQKSHNSLKTGGVIALNVSYGDLYNDTINILNDYFTIKNEYKMRLSKLCGRLIDKNKETFKYEPIIIGYKK